MRWGEAAVSDGYGSQFYPLETVASSGKQFVTYYAHLSEFGTEYYLTVNGNEVKLGNNTLQ